MNNESPEGSEQPPEREFDQSEAWDRMEAAVAESVEGLTDFPGFEVRMLTTSGCSHNGKTDEDYVNLELTYQFSAEDSATTLVHETYVGEFREQWTEAGYDIHRDETRGSDYLHHIIEARRPDGINYWYTAANLATLVVQSGCVKKAGVWPSSCPEPIGGVTDDRAPQAECNDIGESSEGTDAVAPFEGTQAAIIPSPSDGNRRGDAARHPW